MQQTVYVGPYITVPGDFEWYDWEDYVADGICEGRRSGEPLALVLNRQIDRVDRKTSFDREDIGGVYRIDYWRITTEAEAFREFIKPLTEHLRENGIEFSIGWGVVQGWG